MTPHPLDRPVWASLTTRHRGLAVGSDLALRFLSDVSPFAAARDNSPECLAALADLIPEGGSVMMAESDEIVLPPGTGIVEEGPGVQMLAEDAACDRWRLQGVQLNGLHAERLGDADAAEMCALAKLTQPGPFEMKTHLLGEFFGVREGGRLVAMAGERFKQPGYTEISGVCTHPDVRGRGIARTLSDAAAARIVARGETPYLHAWAKNAPAITLYESLGFRIRRTINVVRIARIG